LPPPWSVVAAQGELQPMPSRVAAASEATRAEEQGPAHSSGLIFRAVEVGYSSEQGSIAMQRSASAPVLGMKGVGCAPQEGSMDNVQEATPKPASEGSTTGSQECSAAARAAKAEAECMKALQERDEARQECTTLQQQMKELQGEYSLLKHLLEKQRERRLELEKERDALAATVAAVTARERPSIAISERPPSPPRGSIPVALSNEAIPSPIPTSSTIACSAITEVGAAPEHLRLPLPPHAFQPKDDTLQGSPPSDVGIDDSFWDSRGLPFEEDPRVVRRHVRMKKKAYPLLGLCC